MLKRKALTTSLLLTAILLTILSALIFASLRYKQLNFASITADELLFLVLNPTVGMRVEIFSDSTPADIGLFLLVLTLMITPLIAGYAWYAKKLPKQPRWNKHFQRSFGAYAALYGFGLFVFSAAFGLHAIGMYQYLAGSFSEGQLYEQHYRDPRTAKQIVAEKRRNLIVVYLESTENTLASTKNGGASPVSLIPELEAIATDPATISFSHTDKLGGAQEAFGTTWTVAALASTTAGIPLIPTAGIENNDFGTRSRFLPGAYSMGEILQQHDYQQAFMIGSDAGFGGRDKYFTQHGDHTIFDLNSAKQAGKIPSDYHVWWGFEDRKLFSFAKEEISRLAKSDQPFNFQLLTVDTHFVDGYLDPSCPKPHDSQYKNVYACSSREVASFVDWVKRQPFYDNTTIVLLGDHLGMQTEFYDSIAPSGYTRTIYNAFINAPKKPIRTKNRVFTSFDMYPTLLSSIGITTEADKLGLGTDLFSDTPTLAEKIGLDVLNNELGKRSRFYTTQILR